MLVPITTSENQDTSIIRAVSTVPRVSGLEIFHCIMRHTHWGHKNEAVCTMYVHVQHVQHVEHVEHVNEHVMFIGMMHM